VVLVAAAGLAAALATNEELRRSLLGSGKALGEELAGKDGGES
jgi:hypothetical protein